MSNNVTYSRCCLDFTKILECLYHVLSAREQVLNWELRREGPCRVNLTNKTRRRSEKNPCLSSGCSTGKSSHTKTDSFEVNVFFVFFFVWHKRNNISIVKRNSEQRTKMPIKKDEKGKNWAFSSRALCLPGAVDFIRLCLLTHFDFLWFYRGWICHVVKSNLKLLWWLREFCMFRHLPTSEIYCSPTSPVVL